MLRPASPLSVLMFAAFALMLLTVLSPPIISALPLGSFGGVKYGVFGSCSSSGCSDVSVGYDALTSSSSDWRFPSSARQNLPRFLVLHIAGAALTLIVFVMALVAHFHSASHSSRYLLAHFILSVVTILVCIAAFVIDFVLFAPHTALGTWFTLAAALLALLGSIAVCINRGMMMNRKNRRRAFQETPDKTSEPGFYVPATVSGAIVADRLGAHTTFPVASGANQSPPDSTPQYMTVEETRQDDVASDHVPLTQSSPTVPFSTTAQYPDVAPQDPRPSMPVAREQQYPTDGFNTVNAVNSYSNGPNAMVGRSPSFDQQQQQQPGMRGQGRGGSPMGSQRGGYRGRGGYGPGPRGRGGPYAGQYEPRGHDPRAGYNNPAGAYSGGYSGPQRGGYSQRGAPAYGRGRGGGPGGYRGGGGGYTGERPGRQSLDYYNGALDLYSGGPPAMGAYQGSDSYQQPARRPSNGYDDNGGYYDPNDFPRAESPPPLPSDQVVVDDRQPDLVVAPQPESATQQTFNFGLRDSDADVAGMVGLQQSRQDPPLGDPRHQTYMTQSSQYSTDDYSSNQFSGPRKEWNNSPNIPHVPSPLQVPTRTTTTSPTVADPNINEATYNSEVSTTYGEDVAPSHPPHTATGPRPRPHQLAPADALPPPFQALPSPPPRAMSPGAASDYSTFTSISQRGVNPRWNPNGPPSAAGNSNPNPNHGNGRGMMDHQPPPPPRRQARQDVLLLGENPDFAIPARKTRPGAGGLGGAYPNMSAF